MHVNNTQKKEIVLSSFEGYKFFLPTGVSWIWDKAGEHLLNNIYKIELPIGARKTPDGRSVDKYGFDNGFGVPPLLASNNEAWVKGGKQLTRVERFKVNGKLVPRKTLVTVAQQRGVPNARILEYLADPQVDVMMIADDINALPVPEEVRYPKNFEEVVTPQMKESVA